MNETHKMMVGYHTLYCDGLSADASFPRDRYPKLKLEVDNRIGTSIIEWFSPRRASEEEISDIHNIGYVLRFLQDTLTPKEKRQIGLRPWTSDIIERTLRLTGGTIQAMEFCIQSNGYAGNLAGGTHHAFKDHGSGFCIFNDIAIAAIRAMELGCERITVIDLDVHQGDGTASICQEISNIHTISVHCEKNFPFRKQHSDLDIPLPQNCADQKYLEAVEMAIDSSQKFNPDAIIFQGGVDPLYCDRLGRMNISREGLQQRNNLIYDYADRNNLPCLVLMGGGYSVPIEDTVDCFADMFIEAAKRHSERTIE